MLYSVQWEWRQGLEVLIVMTMKVLSYGTRVCVLQAYRHSGGIHGFHLQGQRVR